jgi:hypothetical protein
MCSMMTTYDTKGHSIQKDVSQGGTAELNEIIAQ